MDTVINLLRFVTNHVSIWALVLIIGMTAEIIRERLKTRYPNR